jgi:hypothetical protein
MISSADLLYLAMRSTGMPRPLSSTVMDLPSSCRVTSTRSAWWLMTSSIELSRISHRRWW